MKFLAAAFVIFCLTGCATTTGTALSLYSAQYSCPSNEVSAEDLYNHITIRVRGCGYEAVYSCTSAFDIGCQQQGERKPLRSGSGRPEVKQSAPVVTRISPDSQAEHAGLQIGDAIHMYGTHNISNSHQLRRYASSLPEHQSVTITYVRDGATKTADVHGGLIGVDLSDQLEPSDPPH